MKECDSIILCSIHRTVVTADIDASTALIGVMNIMIIKDWIEGIYFKKLQAD